VRSNSRTERVVDLHEAGTLEAVSAYVMHERPHDTMSPILFLVGGNGPRRHEALSYAALLRLFALRVSLLHNQSLAPTGRVEPGAPMTLGSAAAAQVGLIVWCRVCTR